MRSSWIIAGVVVFLTVVTGLVIWMALLPSSALTNRIVSLHPDYEAQLTNGEFTGDWKKGVAGAPVQVVEYADYECPACAGLAPVLQSALVEVDFVEFTYRHFPLPQHSKARTAARAVEAAGRQGKYWEMSQIIYSQQDTWSRGTMSQFRSFLSQYAGSLGLNTAQFEADLNDSSIDKKIQRDQKAGNDLSVDATPTIFINGTRLLPVPTTVDGLIEAFTAAKNQTGE